MEKKSACTRYNGNNHHIFFYSFSFNIQFVETVVILVKLNKQSLFICSSSMGKHLKFSRSMYQFLNDKFCVEQKENFATLWAMNGHLFRIHTPRKCAKLRASESSLFTHSLHHFPLFSFFLSLSLTHTVFCSTNDNDNGKRMKKENAMNHVGQLFAIYLNGMCFSKKIYQCFKWIVVLYLSVTLVTISIYTSFSPRFFFGPRFSRSFVRSSTFNCFEYNITRCKIFLVQCFPIPFCCRCCYSF